MTYIRRIDVGNIRDIGVTALDPKGRLKVMPAEFYAATTVEERAVFGARNAAYLLPTMELVSWLKSAIGQRTAIEIGSGNGVLATALGIPGTDSCLQAQPEIAQLYRSAGQKTVDYGQNVLPYAAENAVKNLRPKVVVAAWVTHKYSELRHEAGGNMFGVIEEDVIASCETYIFIGNSHVHKVKSIWALPHHKIEPPWLYSRAHNGSPEFIAVWGKAPAAITHKPTV